MDWLSQFLTCLVEVTKVQSQGSLQSDCNFTRSLLSAQTALVEEVFHGQNAIINQIQFQRYIEVLFPCAIALVDQGEQLTKQR